MQIGHRFRRAIPRTLAVNWAGDVEWPMRLGFSGFVGYDSLLIFINPPEVSDKAVWDRSELMRWEWNYTHPLGIIFLTVKAGALLTDESNLMTIKIDGPQPGDHYGWSGEYPAGVGAWDLQLTPDSEAVNIRDNRVGHYDGPLQGCIIQPVLYSEEP
jgi:hypothetical protein